MARDWDDLFLVARKRAGPAAAGDELEEVEAGRARGLARLRASLRATRQALGTGVAAGFSKTLADHDWEALEESLILADVGAAAAGEISASLESTVRRERLDNDALRARLVELLADLRHFCAARHIDFGTCSQAAEARFETEIRGGR